VNSTSWFVAVVGVAVGSMALWILLDWIVRVSERQFRPRREGTEQELASRSQSRGVTAQPNRAKSQAATSPPMRERSASTPNSGGDLEAATDVATDAELDFDYIDSLRRGISASSGNGDS
jgi:hypothetical protein